MNDGRERLIAEINGVLIVIRRNRRRIDRYICYWIRGQPVMILMGIVVMMQVLVYCMQVGIGVQMQMARYMQMRSTCMIIELRPTVVDMAMGFRHTSNEELNDDNNCNCEPHVDLLPHLKSTTQADEVQPLGKGLHDASVSDWFVAKFG